MNECATSAEIIESERRVRLEATQAARFVEELELHFGLGQPRTCGGRDEMDGSVYVVGSECGRETFDERECGAMSRAWDKHIAATGAAAAYCL